MPQSGGRGEEEGVVWEQQQQQQEEGAGQARQELVKYGELVILGYNGALPQGDKGRRRSKFVLYRRSKPIGESNSKHYVVKTPQTSQAILDTKSIGLSLLRPTWNMSVLSSCWYSTITAWFLFRV